MKYILGFIVLKVLGKHYGQQILDGMVWFFTHFWWVILLFLILAMIGWIGQRKEKQNKRMINDKKKDLGQHGQRLVSEASLPDHQNDKRINKQEDIYPSSNKTEKDAKIDFSQRTMCSDESCIGTINDQGVCNICGKPNIRMTGNEKCFNHPQRSAVSFCISCKRYFCEDCLTKVLDYYCCGSESCKKKAKQAMHNAIELGARSLADEIINVIDGGLTSHKKINIAPIYIEIIFVFIHYLMELASKYLDEEEKINFVTGIYAGIHDILAKRYSTQIDIKEFHVHFENSFKERMMEYRNFVGLDPRSYSEDPLYMSFGKRLSNILGKDFDLETDTNIQALYSIAHFPLLFIRIHLEEIKRIERGN